MSAIGKGDWVQAIQSDTIEDGPYQLIKGRTYYCEGLIEGTCDQPCGLCGDDEPGIILAGITPPGWGWCHCSLKPLGGGLGVGRKELVEA